MRISGAEVYDFEQTERRNAMWLPMRKKELIGVVRHAKIIYLTFISTKLPEDSSKIVEKKKVIRIDFNPVLYDRSRKNVLCGA